MSETTSNSNGRGLFILLILLLLGVNGWLFYNAYKNKEEQKKIEISLAEKDSLLNKLNADYVSLQLELESQKGMNAEKDAMIANMQEELTAKKDEIQSLLKSKNFVNKKSSDVEKLLEDARRQIDALTAERDGYIAKLDSLNAAYATLAGEYNNLNIQYNDQVALTEKVIKEKDSIFQLGSIILADNISVTGVRTKNSGKEKEDQKAKKADRLKVCFDLMKNKLSAGSAQTVYVKIIGPDGLTLFDSGNGSGEFVNLENNNDSRYTTSVTMDYAGDDSQSYCVYWDPGADFNSGDYEVMIFNQGYCVGKNEFNLKASLF
ncbi:MAG: hypothetical protein ACKVPJ_11570 [Chitinophagales bacterium]